MKVTNEEGAVTFENVPINNYIISVEDSKNFMGNEKSLNLISERTIQPSFSLFIELKPQVYSFVELNLTDERGAKATQASVSAILLATNEMLEVDRITFFFRFHEARPEKIWIIGYMFDLYKNDRGMYTATLVPGDYILNASSPGCKELSEYFLTTKGECHVEFKMAKKAPSKLSVTSVDLGTGVTVSGALLKLSTPSRSMNVEGLADATGKSVYTTDGCGYYTLSVSREGYVPYTKDLCISKTSLSEIVVPLIPHPGDTERTTIQVCLSGDAAAKGMSFKVYCPQDAEVLGRMKAESGPNAARISKEHAEKVGSVLTIFSGINEWYRVCVELTNPELASITKEDLDRYIQNRLQALNVVVHIAVNGELKYTLYPPASISGTVWDIGFINAFNGELMAVNAISETAPNNRLELSNEYFTFYGYVCQKQNLRAAFGFDKAGFQKLDDLVMEPQTFADVIVKALNVTGNSFVARLIAGVSDLFGHVSLKLLTRLVNLHAVSMCEMEYSKTIGSPGIGASTAKKFEFGFLKSSPSTLQKVSSPAKSSIGIIFSISPLRNI